MSAIQVRDAVEDDVDALATLVNAPVDALKQTVHDRTVRVAVDADDGADETDETVVTDETGDSARVVGFVAFDADDSVVHVTRFGGPRAVCERLLDEPVRFAESEEMTVEVVVTEDDEAMRVAVEAKGFSHHGDGPRFEGKETTRYRLSP